MNADTKFNLRATIATVLMTTAVFLCLGGCASTGTIRGRIGDQEVDLATTSKTGLDTEQVAQVATGIASLTPWAGLVTTALTMAGWAVSANGRRKNDRALEDAIAYAEDVTAVDPNDKDRLETVRRDHRMRQLQRGTNAIIKRKFT